jgi:anti-sigma B factor antagonist
MAEPDGVTRASPAEGNTGDDGDRAAIPHVIKIIGELDVSNAHRLRAILEGISDPSPRVIIDMSELSFMDSSGLTVLLEATRRGASVVLRQPSPVVRRLVDVTGLGGVLQIEGD